MLNIIKSKELCLHKLGWAHIIGTFLSCIRNRIAYDHCICFLMFLLLGMDGSVSIIIVTTKIAIPLVRFEHLHCCLYVKFRFTF